MQIICWTTQEFFSAIQNLTSPTQPYNSTRIDTPPIQLESRKRMYLALIGEERLWYTTVSWSIFPAKTKTKKNKNRWYAWVSCKLLCDKSRVEMVGSCNPLANRYFSLKVLVSFNVVDSLHCRIGIQVCTLSHLSDLSVNSLPLEQGGSVYIAKTW